MKECPHCHNSNGVYGVAGCSIQAATNRQDDSATALIMGHSCYNCGHWIEPCPAVAKPIPTLTFKESRKGRNTRDIGRAAIMKIIEHFGEIEKLRMAKPCTSSWEDIADKFGFDLHPQSLAQKFNAIKKKAITNER